MAEANLVVSDGKNSFIVLNPIGKWGPDLTLTVYEAAVNVLDGPRVAIKMMREVPEEQDFYDMAVDDVDRSKDFLHVDLYILPHIQSFHDFVNGVRTLCIILPFDSQVSSLRSCLSRFSSGISENFIALALSRVLTGLDKIHKYMNNHTQITAGNIFYNHEHKVIQLAYGASVYERNPSQNDAQESPIDKMLAWGLAPELRNEDDDSLEFVNEYDTEKSDIWLIGLVALELAYGKIQVANRKELVRIGRYISQRKRLPNTWEELRSKSAEFAVEMDMPPLKRMRFTLSPVEMEVRRFSERFSNFVANCLVTDPKMRASAEVLISHVFLKKNVATMEHFRDVVANGVNPHVLRMLNRKFEKKPAPTVIRDGGYTYTFLKPIGKWGPEYDFNVYEVVARDRQFHPTLHVAFKVINCENEYYDTAVEDADASVDFDWQFILPLSKYFYCHIKGKLTLCMVLQFDSQVVSLRSIMSSCYKFCGGIPQNCISLVLQHAVAGLAELHSVPEYHTQVTAGNIFYCFQDQTIKLAFAGSAYERTYPYEESASCPVNKMLSWGLAPEIEIESYAPLEFMDEYMTGEPDIWLVGIVALELAYGRIQVVDREELLRIASYISDAKILPDSWEELKNEAADEAAKKLANPGAVSHTLYGFSKDSRFDESFGNFVAKCLAEDPLQRPSATELLEHKFLNRNVASMEYFQETIIKESMGFK